MQAFKYVILLFWCMFFTALQAQTTMPETGEITLTDFEGTLLDPGGDDPYSGSSNALAIISPEGAEQVTLDFEFFQLDDSWNDVITLYDGEGTSAPYIGSYYTSNIPVDVNNPCYPQGIIVSSGPSITIEFLCNSDAWGGIPGEGFIINWKGEAFSEEVTAMFSVSSNNPPANANVSFTSESVNADSYLWDFGDGEQASVKNPIHIYNSVGTYTVSLTIYNDCYGLEDTYTMDIEVTDQTSMVADPNPLTAELAYGNSTTKELTLYNNGNVDLDFDIQGASLSSGKKFHIVSLINNADMNKAYPNIKSILENSLEEYKLDEISTTSAVELSSALNGANMLIIPGQTICETVDADAFADFSFTLQSFTENGGTVLFTGSKYTDCIFTTGLLSGSLKGNITGSVPLNTKSDELTEGVGKYNSQVATFYYDITNPDYVSLVDYINSSVFGYRNVGSGKVVMMGHSFTYSNDLIDKLLTNLLLDVSALEDSWLYISEVSGSIPAGGQYTLDVEFDATNLYSGIFQKNIVIINNDGFQPGLVVPCTLTITGGMPSFGLNEINFDFGQVMEGTQKVLDLDIWNNGTDSLKILKIESTDPAFTATPNSFGVYAGGSKEKVSLTFMPDAIKDYEAKMTIYTNMPPPAIADYKINLKGQGVGRPNLTAVPNPLNITVDAGTVTNHELTITNTGGGPAFYTIPTDSYTDILKVKAYVNGMATTGALQNALSSLDQIYTDYSYDESFATSAEELEADLMGTDLFIIPTFTDLAMAPLFPVFAPVLQNFVDNGGHVLFFGSQFNFSLDPTPETLTGLFEGNKLSAGWNPMKSTEIDDPLLEDIPGTIPNTGSIYPFDVTNDDVVVLVTYTDWQDLTFPVAFYREIGTGSAYYLGFNFVTPGNAQTQMLANVFKRVASDRLTPWLSIDKAEGEIGFPNVSEIFNLEVNTTELLGGTYHSSVTIDHNDPLNPQLVVPITLTVIGIPQIQVSDTDLDFGNVIIGNTKKHKLDIVSSGSDSLFITNIVSSNPDFLLSVTEATLKPAGDDIVLTITFAPQTIQTYNETITISTNAGDVVVNVIGVGIGAPSLTWSPDEFNVLLLEGEQKTETLNLANVNGEGPLEWWTPAKGTTTNIGVMTYAIQTWSYNPDAIKGALDNYYGDYTFTETDSSDPDEIAEFLEDKSILLLPSMDFFTMDVALVEAYVPVLQEFLQNGGNIIKMGTGCTDCMDAMGLFDGVYIEYVWNEVVVDTNHPIGKGMPETFLPPWDCMAWDFDDMTYVVTNQNGGGGAVLAYKGDVGKLIYFGQNFYSSDANTELLFSNTIEFASGVSPDWFSLSAYEGIVNMGDDVDIDVMFDATGMLAGVYTYQLPIYTNDPQHPVIYIPVTLTVEALPIADFSVSGTLICGDGSISFYDESQNVPSSWTWDFGDGNTSTDQNPMHTYTEEGVFTITMEACNTVGCDEIVMTDLVTVDFDNHFCDTTKMSVDQVITNEECYGVLLDDGGLFAHGDFTMGTMIIAPPGAITVTLTFTELDFNPGWQGTDGLDIYDGDQATGELIGTYQSMADLPADGKIVASSGIMTIYQHTESWSNTSPGFVATWECLREPPVADFTTEVLVECEGRLKFLDASTNYPTSWKWYFGDGSDPVEGEQTPNHEFTKDGTYTVSLVACNAVGCDSVAIDVMVENIMFVDMDVPVEVVVGKPVTFKDNTIDAMLWDWDFGNGLTGNDQEETTFYSVEGEYTVELTVTRDDGCTRAASQTITVAPEVGIKENELNSKLQLYPNPTTGLLNIELELTDTEVQGIQVFDAIGKIIYDEAIQVSGGTLHHQIDLSGKAKGMYMVNIQTSDAVVTKQVIIQ